MIRNKRYNGTYRKGSGNPCYVIIHDGDTEKWYFQLMKQEENIRISIDYKIFKGDLRAVYEKVLELFSESYTQVSFPDFSRRFSVSLAKSIDTFWEVLLKGFTPS